MKGKYIGARKIAEVKDYAPGAVVVVFEDKTEDILAEKMIPELLTDNPSDATTLRNKRVEVIAGEVLKVFKEWNLKLSEFQHLSQVLSMSLENNYIRAEDILWGTSEKSVLHVDRVLLGDKKTLDDVLSSGV